MKTIYLDWAATTPMDPDIAPQMVELYTQKYGNPSSTHSIGRESYTLIENSRKRCADLLKVEPEQLVFTSGGTEANVVPLLSLIRKHSQGEIILSSIEHAAVYELGSLFRDLGYKVKEVYPDQNGVIQPSQVMKKLSRNTIGVAVMLVNNEVGSIQPVREIAKEIRSFEAENSCKIHFHCDAVQALGKIQVNPQALDADSIAFSGHKFQGPKGIGLLYTKKKFVPLSSGGGQEFSMRPGTENTAAIWAFAEALHKRMQFFDEAYANACKLQERLFTHINEIDGVEVFPAQRTQLEMYSPYIVALTVAPVPGEVCARVLNDRGVAVGTGSACSSNRKKKHGRVIYSITSDENIAQGIIRISTGFSTSESDIDAFIDILKQELALLQKTVTRYN